MLHFPAEAYTPLHQTYLIWEGKSGIDTLSEIAIGHKNLSTIKSWRNTKTALVQIPGAIITKKEKLQRGWLSAPSTAITQMSLSKALQGGIYS